MNEHLNIPIDIQNIINEIVNVDLNFVELPLQEHPKLPQFNRTIRVLNIEAKSEQQFIVFVYKQVLKDKKTGEEINIKLPAPEWVIYKETWSYLRGTNNLPVELTLKDDKGKKDLVKVPSYKYMIWLMKNNKAGFLQLIESYLDSFIKAKQTELDRI
ncbi:hypothetical protein [Chryseobacterium sp.]|uniref:hypothetical protein n=1 Tax=Chryseobacterium sp. TaxID=1871047 RepID=UPI0035B49E87